jgi:hypothetical protein
MKLCPVCQRRYTDDTLSYCLEDGAALSGETSAANDLAATLIIPEPRLTAPVNQDTYRATSPPPPPSVQPFNPQMPAWQPQAGVHALQSAPARQGRGAAVTSLALAITAFVLLGFCIIGGASGVNESLIGGIFLFSILLALVGAVLGIVATSRSSKVTSLPNAKIISIVALVLNGVYLLFSVVFLILGAVASQSR